jgi:hypothetical protein
MRVNFGNSVHSGTGSPRRAERLHFGATGWTIDFHGCEDIVPGVTQVLRGWSLQVGDAGQPEDPSLRAVITSKSGRWDWEERGAPKAREWDAKPPKTPMRVLTDVHDAALYWYLAENPHLLCMHGAAVKIGSGLVCFPARFRAGKSTLMACLAARGHRIYADDVLGLHGRQGMSLGFLPRLRVPLAPSLSSATRSYIDSHLGPSDGSWMYLDPGETGMATLGETTDITTFVLLDRMNEGAPEIGEARTADVLRMLIAENIIRQLPMPEIFDRLHDLALNANRLVLRYSDPQQAARLIEKAVS